MERELYLGIVIDGQLFKPILDPVDRITIGFWFF